MDKWNKKVDAMRSCWECNPAHIHLKDVDYSFLCFSCGKIFYKGEEVFIPDDSEE